LPSLAGRWVSKAGAVLQEDQRPWEDLDEDEKDRNHLERFFRNPEIIILMKNGLTIGGYSHFLVSPQ